MADGEAAEGARVGGRYRVIRLLGEGGMGSVYEAENTWTHRRVALKLLRPEYASNAEAAQRFLREARAAAAIAHPNIIDVLDMGREEPDGALYIVQALLDGRDLRARVEEDRRLAPREAVALLAPVMEALAFAHERGVVHRDIKPENIFLAQTPAGVVPTLIDFGISKVAPRAGDDFRTKAGDILGTPLYMSPEQVSGEAVNGQADVWSMGVVLYELLAGRAPVDAPTPSLALVRIVVEDAPRIEQHAPDIPPDLAAAVHRALERDRARRYPDMRAFLDALRACALPDRPLAAPCAQPPPVAQAPTARLGPAPVAQAPTASLGPAPVAQAPTAFVGPSPVALQPTAPLPPSPPRRDRRRVGLLLAAAALLATCASGGLLVASTQRGLAQESEVSAQGPAQPPPPAAPAVAPETPLPVAPPRPPAAAPGAAHNVRAERPRNPRKPRGHHGRAHPRWARGRD